MSKRNILLLVFLMIISSISIIILFLKNQHHATADVGFFIDTTQTVSKYDTIIDKHIYKSYFNTTYKEPLFVSYVLYKGGGECSREKFRFKNDCLISTATAKDYSKSGYDEGHLANAEDFAYNCEYDELTFRFYNCVPQTPELNRGIWHRWENIIRKESQKDSLLIITGNVFDNETIGNNVYVPSYCWKVVESLSNKNIIHIIYCSNNDVPICDTIKLSTLYKRIGYELPLR